MLKTACWETPGPKKTTWMMKKFSLLPEESIVEKVDSEVIFDISCGDNTRRIEPFKKKLLLALPACLFPKLPCVVCKALAASVVCEEWGPHESPLALTWHQNTHSCHSPVWSPQVLARAGEQGRGDE